MNKTQLLIKNLLFASLLFWVNVTQANTEFFNEPEMTGAVLSPDGAHVAITLNQSDSQNLVLMNTQTGEREVLIDVKQFSKREATLKAVKWIDNQHITVEFIEIKKGVENLIDTKHASQMLVVQIPSEPMSDIVIKSVRTSGTMVSALPKEPYVFLYSKKGVYSKIYKIDARKLLPYKQRLSKLTIKDGGQFKAKNEVVSVAGYVIEWFLAMDGSPKAALHSIDNNLIKLNEFTDDNSLNETELASWDWSELKKIKENTAEKDTKLILPVSMSEQAGVFYSFDFNEDQKRTVYRSNYNTGEHDVVIKSNAYKIINLIQASDNRLIGVRVLKDGMPQTMFLEMMQGQKSPIKPIQELDIVIDSSLDKNTQVVYRESHNMPGRYFVKSPAGKESYIGSVYPNLDNKLQAQLIEDEVLVEGMKIPYLLSMPTTASKPWPLIVMPHGGPIGIFDNRYFNLTTQYLVSRGYAVLRVNFRGSGGYSEELLEAGKKQFGDLILTDIHAATKAVVTRADINADKVCIAGLSYGGYAAAMLAIKQPDYYRCAVSIAGVSDVNLFLNSATISEAQIRWSKEYIGDSSKEYDALLAISPINYIQDLSRPILIMHGAKDTVVDIEHAYRMKLLLDKYNKTYEWYVEPEGEHHFNKPSDAQAMFDKMLTFIDAYIN